MKHTKAKGVLGKDGKPYAPGTFYTVSDEWQAPELYTPLAMMYAFLDDKITKIILVTEDNIEHTVEK